MPVVLHIGRDVHSFIIITLCNAEMGGRGKCPEIQTKMPPYCTSLPPTPPPQNPIPPSSWTDATALPRLLQTVITIRLKCSTASREDDVLHVGAHSGRADLIHASARTNAS